MRTTFTDVAAGELGWQRYSRERWDERQRALALERREAVLLP